MKGLLKRIIDLNQFLKESPTLKWIDRIIIGLVVLLVVFVVVYGRRRFAVGLDDGPFSGTPRQECPQGEPVQRFRVDSEFSLHVFDREESETAPTVSLVDSAGRFRWCIYATAMPNTSVENIRFTGFLSLLPFSRPLVFGRVKWTFGVERTEWSIAKDGSLEWYKYSW